MKQKLFVQRIGLVGIGNVLVSLSSLLLVPILTKSLSTFDYGIWVQLTVTVSFAAGFATLGLPNAMSRFLAPATEQTEIQEGFYSLAALTAVSTLVLALILLLLRNAIAASLFGDYLPAALLLPGIVMFACLNTLFTEFFRAFQQIKKYTAINVAQGFGTIILITLVLSLGYGLSAAIMALFATYFFAFAIMAAAVVAQIGFRFPRLTHARMYLSYSLPLIPWGVSMWMVSASDRYVINWYLGPTAVAYYNPGYVLGTAIMMLIGPVAFMLTPVLAKSYDGGNHGEVRTFLSYSLKYWLILSIPIALGFSLLSKQLLIILSTATIASNGYLVTPFVAASGVLYGLYVIFVQVIALKKATRVSGIIWLTAGALNIAVNFILIPLIGIVGAAISTLLAYALTFVLTYAWVRKHSLVSVDYAFLPKCIIAAVIAAGALVVLNPYGLLHITVAAGFCAALYIGLLLLLKGLSPAELHFFRTLLRRKA